MTKFLGAAPGERTAGRNGYRAGDYSRGLITQISKLELRMPQSRAGLKADAAFDAAYRLAQEAHPR